MDLQSFFFILLVFAAVFAGILWLGRFILLKRARALGYNQVAPYLRAVPETDPQKADAADLALKGGVITILGVVFPPLILIGLVPLYYGLRKVTMTLMGLGLADSVAG